MFPACLEFSQERGVKVREHKCNVGPAQLTRRVYLPLKCSLSVKILLAREKAKFYYAQKTYLTKGRGHYN